MSLPWVMLVVVLAGCSSPKRAFDVDSPDSANGGSDNNSAGSAGKSGTHDSAGSSSGGESGTGSGENGGQAGDDTGTSGSAGTTSSSECSAPGDCEGKDTDCSARTCNDGVCGVEYEKDGVAVTAQISGDCNRTVCNGKGGTRVAVDDADLPVDGNGCTQDLCKNGVRSNPNEPTTTPCGATAQFKCDGMGSCASCSVDADCGQNNLCATFKCTGGMCKTTFLTTDPGQVVGDCKKAVCSNGSITASVDNSDLPVDGKPCTKDLCTSGAPSNPPLVANTACGANSTCDNNGNCVCSDPNACNGKCGTFADACGHSVNCGGCTAPQTCGGGGTANVCGCTPHPVCHDQCGGTVANGCGAAATCPNVNECTCNQGCTPSCGGDICQCGGFCS
ncbi:MAG: hypothetical protein ABW061_11255 [Polyangiaceae bacterium]